MVLLWLSWNRAMERFSNSVFPFILLWNISISISPDNPEVYLGSESVTDCSVCWFHKQILPPGGTC